MSVSSGQDIRSRTTLSKSNVTPLVDVMRVLLIIFMVTAPMMQQGLDVRLPETTNTGLNVKGDPFVLTIKRVNLIYVNKQKLEMNKMKEKLAAIVETRQDRQLYIQADKDVPYGFVA